MERPLILQVHASFKKNEKIFFKEAPMPFNFIGLPIELRDKIVLHTESNIVCEVLKKYTSYFFLKQKIYYADFNNLLIYGPVQSGKTSQIFRLLEFTNQLCVLVLPNSLAMIKQYSIRLKNIRFQIIDSNTTEIDVKSRVLILINNCFRYNKILKLIGDLEYILIIDEADLVYRRCKLKSKKTVYVTATPWGMDIDFKKTIKIPVSNNYRGIPELKINNIKHSDIDDCILKYMRSTGMGIMLISNKYSINDMQLSANKLRFKYPNTPVIIFGTTKISYVGCKTMKFNNLVDVIDFYKHYGKMIIISNRLASRGISFESSDKKFKITHQISNQRSTCNNFLQSLRILGYRETNEDLELYYIGDLRQIYKTLELINSI